MRELMWEPDFRKALSLAIDREEIIDLLYFGEGEPYQFSPPQGSPFSSEEHAKAYTDFDPDRANAMLDALGLGQRNAAGYRLRPDGEEIRILIDIDGSDNRAIEESVLISGYWEEVGIRAQANPLSRAYWVERMDAGEHDVTVRQTGTDVPELITRPRYFVPIEANSAQAPLYGVWYNTNGQEGLEPESGGVIWELQRLYDEMRATADPDEWLRVWHEILDINLENMFVIGISQQPRQYGVAKVDLGNVPDVLPFPGNHGPRGDAIPETYYWR